MNPRLWFAGCVWLCFAGCLPAFDFPRLSISNAMDGFVLSWPRAAVDWTLEGSDLLTSPMPWTRVTAAAQETDGENRTLGIPLAQASRFYRLRWAGPAGEALTGHWPLDEGAGALAQEAGGGGDSLALTGMTWAPGRLGPGSLRFDGVSGRAWTSNAAHRLPSAPGQPFSLSLWFNPDVLSPGTQALAGQDDGGTNGWRVTLHNAGPGTNEVRFTGSAPGAGNALAVIGPTLLLPGDWHQLTVTHDGAEGRLYLDGALLARGSGNVGRAEGALTFGGGLAGLVSFPGRLDDLRAYTNCLSPELVSLAGSWKFDEGSGPFAGDQGLFAQHGRLEPGTAWEPGRTGSGITLGTGFVTISNGQRTVLPSDGAPFSVSFWLRPRGLPAGSAGLMHAGLPGTNGWELVLDSATNGTWLHWRSTNRAGTLDLRAPVALTNDTWARIDLTFNGGIATAYVDARKAGSALGAIRSTRAPLVLGVVPGLPTPAGVLDDLRLYRHERAAPEIGPVAETMWETVLWNSTTNFALRGSGPVGRTLAYALDPAVTPTNVTVTLDPVTGVATCQAGSVKGPDAFAYTVSDGVFTTPPVLVLLSVVEPHWLSPAGGMEEPRDGSRPDRAWVAAPAAALDAIWATNRYYDCFFYAPGLYETRGFKYAERTTANPGCKHVGSGSTGTNRTTLRLVEAIQAWTEESLFGSQPHEIRDGFEVHHAELDVNADQLPIYTRGEPVWLRVPLANPGVVSTVTLRWRDLVAPGLWYWRFGRAAEFTLTALRAGTNAWTTNVVAPPASGPVDTFTLGVEADEILLTCLRRDVGVNFYGVNEMEIAGGTPSLPSARVPGGGPSQLDAAHTALNLVDRDGSSAWASGAEAVAEIQLPLPAGSSVSSLNLSWNCQTLAGVGRLGPADGFVIRARDPQSGAFVDVPFVRTPRTADGLEICRFGGTDSNLVLVTDAVQLILTNREPQVNFYSLREVYALHQGATVPWRVPSSWNQYPAGGSFAAVRAADGIAGSGWGSSVQGTVGAINTGGNNQKFTDLRIIGFGTKAGREGFPMRLVVPLQSTGIVHAGNVLVEDVTFTDPGQANGDTVSVLVLIPSAPNTLTNAAVRRCTVTGLFGYFPNINALNSVHLENCLVDGAHVGSYHEPSYTDQLGPVMIRSNRFLNVRHGIYMSPYPGVQSDTMALLGNEFVLQGSSGYGLGVCDVCNAGPGASITNVVALGNRIRYADWGLRPLASDGGLSYTDMRHVVFGNNLVQLGTRNDLRVRQCPAGTIPDYGMENCEEVRPPGPAGTPPCVNLLRPGYRRAWFNNRNLNGSLLPVRTGEHGAEILAAEQQWEPEE